MSDREPVRWITIKGKHLPVYEDGSIGVGQEEEPKEDNDYEKSLKKHPDAHKETIHGYKVLHYYEGDVPIYEIYDNDGNMLDIADSTNELRDIIRGLNGDDD